MPSDTTPSLGAIPVLAPVASRGERNGLTPAFLQSRRTLLRRRVVFAGLNLALLAGLTAGVAEVFGAGGWSSLDLVLLGCFLVGAPWTVMGVWNAILGVWLLHGRREGLALAAPHLAAGDREVPLTQRTAVAMTVRNEDPTRSFEKLAEIRRSLDATGQGHLFEIFVLSDTTEPTVAEAEARLFSALRPVFGAGAVYRRRTRNTGFKAGNVREFLSRDGRAFTFYLPLDSDSLMSGETIVRMQRIMEAHPKVGILQSLVVGAPATSLFARLFQFGMRHGMRSFTMGAAWWQGDCGPYWGHNALIRAAPFRRHCRLPVLPGKPPLGGHILSHDQVEAALMRRAGYEVRVIPVESESWEENPPTLMDFTQRDLRWCQGNMQYWNLLGMRGLAPSSRFQIFAALMMYFGAPAWMLMTLAAVGKMIEGELADINLTLGIAMFFVMFAVSLIPKLLGMLDVLLTRGETARYGGTLRFLAGGIAETVFSVMLAPVVAFRVTLFLIGLAFGRSMIWGGQNRDAYRLTWGDAARGLWTQALFGIALFAAIVSFAGWSTVVWAAPILFGLILAIPFAVLTASPEAGRLAAKVGLCAIPDELEVPESIARAGYPVEAIPLAARPATEPARAA